MYFYLSKIKISITNLLYYEKGESGYFRVKLFGTECGILGLNILVMVSFLTEALVPRMFSL
jgi:hypothetical protein